MLILTRKLGEKIHIGPDITITVLEFNRRGQMRLGIEAPKDVEILREELGKPAVKPAAQQERPSDHV